MPIVSVNIPQIGEGLQEARLVAVLKEPGQAVKRDEPIYQMETDKAVMDVESPYEGVLVEWLAPVDTILPIGGPVAKMEVADGVHEVGAGGHGPAPAAEVQTAVVAAPTTAASDNRNANIPPRTRAYAKEKGIADDQLASIPSASGKLMPADIDAFLSGGGAVPAAKKGESRGGTYTEAAVPQKQRLLSSRMVRGNQLVVPGTISVAANWEPIERLRAQVKASGGEFQPSAFTMFAFAVAQALKDFPAFRTTIIGDDTFRTYDQASLGIAVALPGDELVIAAVDGSTAMDWKTFANRTREQIEIARGGQDQAHEGVTLSLTNMQSFGLRDAVPVVVPPSVATLFLGEVYNGVDQSSTTEFKLKRYANLGLTFDHRVINGVGAAEFLNAVKANVESIGSMVTF
jgi:pyruvate/2-oxoglutarate dehydrogenase complex dihydrolipoamide acyltransferase (E2) component